jgi:hypothetical protein
VAVPARSDGSATPIPQDLSDDGVAFVRFCRERRRVAWPELYDEMCAVARRRLYRGWGFDELAEHGVEFGLFQLAALAAATRAIIADEAAARCPAAEAARPDAVRTEAVRTIDATDGGGQEATAA